MIVSRRTKNLAISAVAVVLAATVVWSLVPSAGRSGSGSPVPGTTSNPAASPTRTAPSHHRAALQPYAVSLADFTGLPLDTASGEPVDVWVVWGPPVTRRTRVEPVPVTAVLERITTPVTPAGPHTAVLGLPREDIPTMLHADLYGDVGVTLAATTGD